MARRAPNSSGRSPGGVERRPAVIHREPASLSLQEEAATTPESAWLFAWLKSAGLYLGAITAYLGCATTAVLAWNAFPASRGERADIGIWVLVGILTLPLLLAFFFNLLPTLRRRRERRLRPTGKAGPGYFTTAPREDDPYQFFAKGYEAFVEWAGSPRVPLLHLTGLSGSGKSSLINACLKPRLAAMEGGPKTTVLMVRSYIDPLAAMKESLLASWKKPPADYQDLSPLAALRRAAHQLGGSDRVLIVFDQFEEFFLLRAGWTGEKGDPAAPVPALVPKAELAPLRDFLLAFVADPPERVTILLSYRYDHHRLLAPLNLPVREEGRNCMTVEPLDFATAAAFLRSCPGLSVPEERMQRVLREAARQEGGRVVMRPIVANLLGLILQQMSEHPTSWRRTSDLLRGYVRDWLGREVREERVRVCRALLTDFQTTRPRSIAEVSRETGIDPTALDTLFEHLGRAGLLRCLTPGASGSAQRTWQIAHDFIAILMERVLDGVHRSLWHTIRPWLAPGAVVIACVVGLFWPWVEKQQAIRFLGNAGFIWNERDSAVTVVTEEGREIAQIDHLRPSLRRLNARNLNLHGCDALQNVDGLRDLTALKSLRLGSCGILQNVNVLNSLTSLQDLDLNYCCALQNIRGLKGLTSLQNLDLSDCAALEDLNGLKGLTSLRSLKLKGCRAPMNVGVLKDLTVLESLDLQGCNVLVNADVLKDLTALQSLDLRGCPRLQNVDGLKDLTTLQSLDLSDCAALEDLNGLKGLTSLRSLKLKGCRALMNVGVLKDLTALESLDLQGCNVLVNAGVLKDLTALQSLDLRGCPRLQNVDGLKDLTVLQTLGLGECPALQDVNGLKGLTALQDLDLSDCNALQNVDVLEGLTSLRELYLRGCSTLQDANILSRLISLKRLDLTNCSALRNVDGLKGLTLLQRLDLSNCAALQNVKGLKGLTFLQRLCLIDCDKLQNVKGLKGLPSLKDLYLTNCATLQNVDDLEGLTALEYLDLSGCRALENVNGLRGLTSLQSLNLGGCSELRDVNGLKGLTSLRQLALEGCVALSKAARSELQAALPKVRLTWPAEP